MFKTKMNFEYPKYNKTIFEEYFYDKFDVADMQREYLPIFWTGFYISRNYGTGDISDLQAYIDKLDRRKKYFTIVQYDDNILNDLKDLDILIFCQGGWGKYKNLSYSIPLNCTNFLSNTTNKIIFASFVGCIKGRHPIREKMAAALSYNKDYYISESQGYDSFSSIIEQSIFSLCPRGYGQTSFRIHESLCAGSIPVYIYDDPLFPFDDDFDFSEIGIAIHEDNISSLDYILKSVTETDIKKMRERGQQICNSYFSFKGCFDSVVNKVTKLSCN